MVILIFNIRFKGCLSCQLWIIDIKLLNNYSRKQRSSIKLWQLVCRRNDCSLTYHFFSFMTFRRKTKNLPLCLFYLQSFKGITFFLSIIKYYFLFETLFRYNRLNSCWRFLRWLFWKTRHRNWISSQRKPSLTNVCKLGA